MKELICRLSEIESIKITTKNFIDFNKSDYCCNDIEAYFMSDMYEKLCIGQQSTGLFFEAFIKNLKKVIDGKLILHESIQRDLGFMWNEKLQGKKGFFMVSSKDFSEKYWVGLDYQLWEAYQGVNPFVATWLYNDKAGNIIFEVSVLYTWTFMRKKHNDPEYKTYKEFIENYKPLIYRIIPRHIAIEWLNQTIGVYKTFFQSEEDFINKCKILNI